MAHCPFHEEREQGLGPHNQNLYLATGAEPGRQLSFEEVSTIPNTERSKLRRVDCNVAFSNF